MVVILDNRLEDKAPLCVLIARSKFTELSFLHSAFISVDGIHYSWISPIFFIAGMLVFRVLNKNLGKLKIPVAVYISAIVIMAWQAWELYLSTGSYGFGIAAVGTILFLISDFTLSINKFLKPMNFAQFIILPTYFIAQWLIAISTLY